MSLSFLVLFVITVFIGSGLLFIAQPVIAKMLLPRVGGAPAVWTTSVLFFQAVLLAGYVYAHWLGRRSRGTQVAIHAALLLAPLGLLPFQLIDGAPAGGPLAPSLWLYEALVLAVGAPLFVLSASTPLLQKWLSHTHVAPSKDPYFLYAASNAGSLLVLVAYPLLVEPVIGLKRQGALWAWGYSAYAVLALACAAHAWRTWPVKAEPPAAGDTSPAGDFLGASGQTREILVVGIPVLLAYLASERRFRFGLAVGAVIFRSLRGQARSRRRSRVPHFEPPPRLSTSGPRDGEGHRSHRRYRRRSSGARAVVAADRLTLGVSVALFRGAARSRVSSRRDRPFPGPRPGLDRRPIRPLEPLPMVAVMVVRPAGKHRARCPQSRP